MASTLARYRRRRGVPGILLAFGLVGALGVASFVIVVMVVGTMVHKEEVPPRPATQAERLSYTQGIAGGKMFQIIHEVDLESGRLVTGPRWEQAAFEEKRGMAYAAHALMNNLPKDFRPQPGSRYDRTLHILDYRTHAEVGTYNRAFGLDLD